MKESIIQSTGGNQYVQVEMKGKQRELGTQSHLNASNESGGKGGSQYLFHILHNSSLFRSHNFFNPKIYTFTAILSPICK